MGNGRALEEEVGLEVLLWSFGENMIRHRQPSGLNNRHPSHVQSTLLMSPVMSASPQLSLHHSIRLKVQDPVLTIISR